MSEELKREDNAAATNGENGEQAEDGDEGEGEGDGEEEEGEHRLQHPYWLWYRSPSADLQENHTNATRNYEQSLAMVGRCSTVEQWWGMYSHLKRTEELPADASFHLFKVGVRPMWEDAANINGGKWEVRLRRALGSWAWEEICMAVIGEQFRVGDEITGAVVNVRTHEVALAVWHRTASDQAASASIQDTMRQILHLPPWTPLEYKRHSKSLRAATFSAPPQPDRDPPS